MTRLGPALTAAIVVGCATDPVPPPRFANAPAVTKVNDRRDVAIQPEEIETLADLDAFDSGFYRPITRTLELPRQRRALGVNAIDEVPDSTWFTNRRGLTLEQMRAGAVTIDNPELHMPWTITSSKPGGASIGYIFKDARGVKFLMKFDTLGFPELETGTDVIVDRLLWAAGYNVPENQISYFRPSDLVVASDAVMLDPLGGHLDAFDRNKLARDLKKVQHDPDGRIRCLVSRWLDGKPLGDPPIEGVRRDDPNDRIPHELRRDLRGMYTIYAWLDVVDVISGNMLDMWVADPGDRRRHYVVHYALDFGMSLGSMGQLQWDLHRGQTYLFDWGELGKSFITLGWWPRRWDERVHPVRTRGVSPIFDVASFDPGAWHSGFPYVPFLNADRFDNYWGAKIVLQFSRAQIHAAVEAARFSDPRSTDYITDTLVARQHAIAAYWFAQVAPIDRVEIDPSTGLCFEDLGIEAGVTGAALTKYTVAATDQQGRGVGAPVAIAATGTGHTCLMLPALSRDSYTIFAISVQRANVRGTTFVHTARDPATHQPRVIGIWRD